MICYLKNAFPRTVHFHPEGFLGEDMESFWVNNIPMVNHMIYHYG